MKIKYTLSLSFIILGLNLIAQDDLNTIERAMKDEMDRSMSELKSDKYDAPFFIRYRVVDADNIDVLASLGSIQQTYQVPSRSKEIRVMVGDYSFNDESLDDTGLDAGPSSYGYMDFSVPVGDDYFGIRRSLWITTDAIYKQAGQIYKAHKAKLKKEDKKPEDVDHRWFAEIPQVEYLEPVKGLPFSKLELENFAKQVSGFFLEYGDLVTSTVRVNSSAYTTYMLNSEGTRSRISSPFTRILISAAMLSEKETVRYDTYTYDLYPGDKLPSIADAEEQVDKLIERMRMNDKIEPFKDNYYGPVLITGKVVPQLMNSYLVGQLYASTMVEDEDDYYGYGGGGNTMDDQLEKRVVSKNLSVTLHTNMEEWNEIPLRGSYKIDGEGVMTPDTLVLIENGTLKNLMSTRTIVREGQRPTGTGNGPGVVKVTASETMDMDALKEKLIALAKENDQEYGIIIKAGPGFDGLYSMNVFQIDVETGEEKLLSDVNISDFALNKLKRIAGISSNLAVNEVGGTSYIAPDAMLLEDVGLSGSYQQMKMKAPLVSSPLLENE